MLPRSKSKRITIGPDQFRYVVNEAISSSGDTVPLAVTVQHESANGALLRVTGLTVRRVPIDQSKWYDGRTVARPIKPPQIVGLILRAKQSGWVPESPGPPFVLQVQNDDVFEPGVSA